MRPITLSPSGFVVRVQDLPGRGTPLLFVHGLGCASSCDYPRVVGSPALAGRRALLVDLLGSGFSDKPESFDYSVEAHAGVVAAIVRQLDLRALDLYGHSMGGSIAIVAAAQLNARVRSLILSEPNLDAGGGTFSRAIAAQSEEDYGRSGHAETVRSAAAAGNLVWSGSLAVTLPLAAHRGAVSLVRGGAPSWRSALEQLTMRRTVLFGVRSLPDDDTARLPRCGVEVALVADAGHSMAWENPDGLASAIAAASSSEPPWAASPAD